MESIIFKDEMKETELYIKNMVCNRCKMFVEERLKQLGFTPVVVELGKAIVAEQLSPEDITRIKESLEAIGFELIDDRSTRIVEQIKTAIIELINHKDGNLKENLSDYLADVCHSDYSALSKLFSEVTCTTIEKYWIAQKIEKVKELLMYNELSLSEIAFKLNYSSTAHLSAQFKAITGMTPTQFKKCKKNLRKPLDQVGINNG